MADEHQKWLDRGYFLLEHGRYEQAEVEVRRALAGEVDRSYGFYLLAWGQAKLGKLAEAEENARRSLAENPASARGYEVLTLVFDQRGQLAQAEKAARSAL